MAYDTVANLISDAAIEMGLIVAAVADPFASVDQNIVQLLRLLKSAGRDLTKRRDWRHLQKEFTFPTVNGQDTYALPADFRSLVPQTGWNRTTQFPLGGPVQGEYWQFRKAVVVGSVVYTNIRFWLGQIRLEATPTSVQTIAFEYQSTSWVKPAAQATPTLDAPAAKDDVIYFDPLLMVKRLKLDFRKEKKFDTVSEQDAYDDALYASECEDSPSSTIFLGGRVGQIRKLDRFNIPDTGVGQ